MKIHKIRTNVKAVSLTAALFFSAAAFSACGGGEPVDLSSMTDGQQRQMEQELAEALKVDGVKMFALYGDQHGEDVTQRSFAIAVTVDGRSGDGGSMNDGLAGGNTTENGSAAGEIENDDSEGSKTAGGGSTGGNPTESDSANGQMATATVTYDIYDLAQGLPKKSTVPVQTISVEGYEGSDSLPCEVQDMNFDGAQDISLWLWSGAQNAQGKFFLWDEEQSQFRENQELGKLVSPVVKPEYAMIQEHVHISAQEYTDTLYRWEEESLVPVRRILQRAPNDTSLECEVYDWYEDYWEPMYERKILVSAGEWSRKDYEKAEELTAELAAYYDPEYIGW